MENLINGDEGAFQLNHGYDQLAPIVLSSSSKDIIKYTFVSSDGTICLKAASAKSFRKQGNFVFRNIMAYCNIVRLEELLEECKKIVPTPIITISRSYKLCCKIKIGGKLCTTTTH